MLGAGLWNALEKMELPIRKSKLFTDKHISLSPASQRHQLIEAKCQSHHCPLKPSVNCDTVLSPFFACISQIDFSSDSLKPPCFPSPYFYLLKSSLSKGNRFILYPQPMQIFLSVLSVKTFSSSKKKLKSVSMTWKNTADSDPESSSLKTSFP